MLKRLDFTLKHVATVFFILFFITVLVQVFFRYFLNSPLSWTEEAARYLNIWAVLLGAALTHKNQEHLRVDIIDRYVSKWPAKAQAIYHFILTLLPFTFFIILVKGSYYMTVDRWNVQLTILPLPQGVVYLALFISILFMLLFSLFHFRRCVILWRSTKSEVENK